MPKALYNKAKRGLIMTLYPDIKVSLHNEEGNKTRIIGAVMTGLRLAEVPDPIVSKFVREAMDCEYENLLKLCMTYVKVV